MMHVMKPIFSISLLPTKLRQTLAVCCLSLALLLLVSNNKVAADPPEFEDELEQLELYFEDEHEAELEELERLQEEELEREQQEELDEEVEEEFEQFMAQKLQESSEELLEVVFDELQFQDQYGQAIWGKEWKVLVSQRALDELKQLGYVFSDIRLLPAFQRVLATIKAPASFDFNSDYQQLVQTLDAKNAIIDRNHIYSSSSVDAGQKNSHSPQAFIGQPGRGKGLSLGMLDTAIDLDLAVFEHSHIKLKSFTPNGLEEPLQHGTQIASLLSGNSAQYQGLLPQAKLFAASVFFSTLEQKNMSTAEALIQGLNWLLENQVPVINMSLSGPPNRLLEFAIQQMCDQGISVIAAAGNQGPLSEPLYPAAYPCTLAVTAVDKQHKIYPMAVQGEHISLAAIGVNVKVVDDDGVITTASGTSIAAPFVSAQVALQRSELNWLPKLFSACLDLGVKGKDTVFGYGLLQAKTHNSGLAAINVDGNRQTQH